MRVLIRMQVLFFLFSCKNTFWGKIKPRVHIEFKTLGYHLNNQALDADPHSFSKSLIRSTLVEMLFIVVSENVRMLAHIKALVTHPSAGRGVGVMQ